MVDAAIQDERTVNLIPHRSTRAAARIFTPVVSGSLFAASCGFRRFPGGLPFLTNAACALLAVPIPLLLRRAERKEEAKAKGSGVEQLY